MKKIIIPILLLLLLLLVPVHAESVYYLPDNIEVIAPQAFTGAACEKVVLPQGVTEIGTEAFMDSMLKKVYLPDSIKTIGERAFYGCDELIAYVVAGSAAEQWCTEKGINTVELAQIPPVWITGVKLNTTTISLNPGEKYKLSASVVPENATADVNWINNDSSVAAVDSDGFVTAVSPGKTSIICEAGDGSGKVAMCQVTVKKDATYRALLIGETGYSSQLRGPDNDVEAMEAMLNGLEMGYEVTSQIDATKSEIIDLVDLILGEQGEDDISLFYYSGHGVTNSSTYYSGALMTVDVDYISTDELADMLSAVKGKVIVILDSCGSGAAVKSKSANKVDFDPAQFNAGVINAFKSAVKWQAKSGELREEKFTVLTSSAYEEDSRTTNSEGVWGGLFTKSIVWGNGFEYLSSDFCGEAPADKDKDTVVTLTECQEYCQICAEDYQHIQAWPENSTEELWLLPTSTGSLNAR